MANPPIRISTGRERSNGVIVEALVEDPKKLTDPRLVMRENVEPGIDHIELTSYHNKNMESKGLEAHLKSREDRLGGEGIKIVAEIIKPW